MREISSYETDVKHATDVNRGILTLIGIWPDAAPSKKARKSMVRVLTNVLCELLLSFILVPGLLKIFLKEKDPRIRLKMLGPMFNCFMAVFKYTVFVLRVDRLRDCLRQAQDDWKRHKAAGDRRIMLESANFGRNIALVCVSFVYVSGFSYSIVVPLSKGAVITADNTTSRPLAVPGYFVLFDPQKTPFYEIVFVLQFLAGFITYSVTSGVISLAAFFVLHACGQLRILVLRMQELVQGSEQNCSSVEERLGELIRRHIRISSFVRDVQDAMQHMCLVEVVGCTLILCLLGYYVIMEWEDSDAVAMLTYGILLVTFIFNIFIYCFIGELLMEQAVKFAITSRTLDWYRLPEKTARCLILIMIMSNYPRKLKAGHFIDLSFNSFCSIVRTSIAYLNMLRATNI